MYNVIDSRQSYLQDVVEAGLRALGFNEQADELCSFLVRDGGVDTGDMCRTRNRPVR